MPIAIVVGDVGPAVRTKKAHTSDFLQNCELGPRAGHWRTRTEEKFDVFMRMIIAMPRGEGVFMAGFGQQSQNKFDKTSLFLVPNR